MAGDISPLELFLMSISFMYLKILSAETNPKFIFHCFEILEKFWRNLFSKFWRNTIITHWLICEFFNSKLSAIKKRKKRYNSFANATCGYLICHYRH